VLFPYNRGLFIKKQPWNCPEKCKIGRFSLLHHFRHWTKHRSRHFNHYINYRPTNPSPTISTSNISNISTSDFSKQLQIHHTHLIVVFYCYWPTLVETPIFHSVIWYLAYTHSNRFETFTIEKVYVSQAYLILSINSIGYGLAIEFNSELRVVGSVWRLLSLQCLRVWFVALHDAFCGTVFLWLLFCVDDISSFIDVLEEFDAVDVAELLIDDDTLMTDLIHSSTKLVQGWCSLLSYTDISL